MMSFPRPSFIQSVREEEEEEEEEEERDTALLGSRIRDEWQK